MNINSSKVLKVFNFLRKKAVLKIIFWVSLYVFLLLAKDKAIDWETWATLQSIKFFVIFTVVYSNIYILVPKYFSQKHLVKYFTFLLLSLVTITCFEIISSYLAYSNLELEQRQLYRNLLIQQQGIYFLGNLFFAGTATMSKIIFDWFRHQREKQQLETQKMTSELRFLRSQVNPHFLFNTLNSLYALTLKKSDDAPNIVLKLSEMMRYMLYECNEKYVSLSKEINYIQNYLELERIRYGQKRRITFEVEGNSENIKIAPLMFIPFLENAFKHGLNSQIQDGYVDSILFIDRKECHFHIENSKKGTAPSIHKKRNGGIGLKNVKRRLNLIYPKQHELTLKDTPNSFAVDLTINYKYV